MTQRKPFQIGDRVRVYHRFNFTGKIETISPDGHIGVIEDGFYSQHKESPFHPKQCRRLIPKPKPEKQERLVRFYFPHDSTIYNIKQEHLKKQVRLVECSESERVASREELAIAFGNAMSLYLPKQWKASSKKIIIECFLDHFGLAEGVKK